MADQLTPTAARRTTLTGSMAALDTGGDGPVILLLPGYTGSKEDFAPILDPLAANGFRALAVDLPGQFESPGPGDEASYRPEALGPVIATLIAELATDRPVVLLGHSYGGLVARSAVLAGAPVAGLLLLCSGPASFTSGARLTALLVSEPILREQGQDAAYGVRAAADLALGKRRIPEMVAFTQRRFLASNSAGLLGMASALIASPDLTAELVAALHGRPVAVIAGADDDAWPLDVQRTMARQLGSDLVLIAGAAHSPAVEAPAALLEVMIPLCTDWTRPG